MLRRALIVGTAAGLSACIPYSVGTTAAPATQQETTIGFIAMPPFAVFDTTRGRSWMSIDVERRIPIDKRSDAGIRAVGFSGAVVTYKRLLTDSASRTRAAVMPGFGFLNYFTHAHFEATLLMSGYEPPPGRAGSLEHRSLFVPYGGLRVMQVAPLNPTAVQDRPTAGGFFGMKFGSSKFGVSPEVGVFYDHSALGVRRGDLAVVPSINVHGDSLFTFLMEMFRRNPLGGRRPF